MNVLLYKIDEHVIFFDINFSKIHIRLAQ